MAISERRRAIQAGVEELRQHMGDAPVDDQPMPFGNLAELVGYTCALARSENVDEAAIVEMLILAADLTREMILDAEAVLGSLGYRAVASMMRRIARSAPSCPRNRWDVRSGDSVTPTDIC